MLDKLHVGGYDKSDDSHWRRMISSIAAYWAWPMRPLLSVLSLLALIPVAGRAETIGAPVIDSVIANYFGISIDESVGYSFTTNAPVTILSLGGLDDSGLTHVRLYDSTGDLLAYATVLPSDPRVDIRAFAYTYNYDPSMAPPPPDSWPIPYRFHLLDSPVSLAANKTYYILDDNHGYPADGSASNPAITILATLPPGVGVVGFGPNLGIQVPEPGSAILLLAAAATLLLYKLRRRAVYLRSPRDPYLVFWVPKLGRL